MGKKTVFFLYVLIVGCVFVAYARVDSPHGASKTAALRLYMNTMEAEFVNLTILTSMDQRDYQAMAESIKILLNQASQIAEKNKNPQLEEPLINLQGKLEDLLTAAKKKQIAKIIEGKDSLLSTCFSCHKAHAPKQ